MWLISDTSLDGNACRLASTKGARLVIRTESGGEAL